MARTVRSTLALAVLLLASHVTAIERYGVWDNTVTGTISVLQGEYDGSCGYGKTNGVPPYNLPTIATSSVLYQNGAGCGACYAVQCVQSQLCRLGVMVPVTVTSQCNGGESICQPGKKGITMSSYVYDKIVLDRIAGNVPVRVMRIPCRRRGGIVIKPVMATDYFIAVLILNAAGPGGIASVSMNVGRMGWQPMSRNFGGVWSVSGVRVIGAPISFHLVSVMAKLSVTAMNVFPATWRVNGTYVYSKNFPYPGQTVRGR